MKHSKTRRKPNVFMPLIILFVLLPFSFSVGGLTGGETSKKGGDFVTLIAKVYHKGQVVARPTMISKFGEASQIVMGDSDDRGTWFLEVTVEPDGDYLRARGKVCFTINKFEPGKIPDCKNDNHFEFAQKPEVPLTLKTPENPYTYEFVLHKGAKTKKFLRHLDVHDGENWMVKKIVVEE